jgi:hypothetical protein
MQELHRTLDDLYDEMELWTWTEVQQNRWARAMKARNQVGVRPMWPVDEQEDEKKQLSWATATRPLRRLKARIVKVGSMREHPQELEFNSRYCQRQWIGSNTNLG